MGCFGKIISLIILLLAFIGFKSLGGIEFFQNLLNNFNNSQKNVTISNLQKSFIISNNIAKSYTIEGSKDFFGFKLTEIEYQNAPQKIFILDSKGLIKLNKKDFYSKEIGPILERIIDKFSYQAIRIENLKITDSGSFAGLGQKIPYIIFEADVVRGKNPKIRGMLGIAENPKGKNDIILSYITIGKYNQKVTENFLRQINYKK